MPTDKSIAQAFREIRPGLKDVWLPVQLGDWIEQRAAELDAQPRGEGERDVSQLQRYFPSKPSHPGWEMTPHKDGEWVMFADVARWWSGGEAVVHENDDARKEYPISYSVQVGSRRFNCGLWGQGKADAEWLAAKLNATPTPPADVPVTSESGGITSESEADVARGELPKLPRPSLPADSGSAVQRTHGYTADQMRAYGEQCRLLGRGERQ